VHVSTEPDNKVAFLGKVHERNEPPDKLLQSVPNMSRTMPFFETIQPSR
jgi:hypothetical protein